MRHMQRVRLLVLTSTLLAACGGTSSPNPGPGPGPGPGPSNGTTLTAARMAACPVVSTSSDPEVSACLAGTVVGKTPSGAECKLVIEASGNYQYTSPTVTSSFVATPLSNRVFSHTNVGGPMVIWLIASPLGPGESYDLDFTYTSALGKKVDIEATKYLATGGSTASSCTTTLN